MDKHGEAEEGKTTRTGYCRPPRHARFKPGVSGNPRGRPRGTLNLATVLERALREKVVINEDGQCTTVTKLEAVIKRLTNQATSGDLKAVQLLAALIRSAEERSVQAAASRSALDDADEKVVLEILNRLKPR